MIFNSQFLDITPDFSKLSEDLREIKKKARYYSTQLYEIPRRIEENLVTLKDLQAKIQNLEQIYSSRKGNTGGRLPLLFGTEPLLRQKNKNKMVIQKPLTDE